MTEVKVSQGQIFELTKQANDIHARLLNTLDKLDTSFASMEKSMLKMRFEITKNTESIQKINEELECQRTEDKNGNLSSAEKLEAEIRRIDDKGKIDVVVWVKDNYEKILLTVIFVGYIISKFI